jgi:hypothetical protein
MFPANRDPKTTIGARPPTKTRPAQTLNGVTLLSVAAACRLYEDLGPIVSASVSDVLINWVRQTIDPYTWSFRVIVIGSINFDLELVAGLTVPFVKAQV